jgi:Pyruvate/2-oxoacid:ferredoxin oxidoreductase delta subunit/bacterioferritin-associated ferredoxin
MRLVNTVPVLDEAKCIGCVICTSVCPTLAWSVDRKTKLAVLNEPLCFGCVNCESRCPTYAIKMVPREEDRHLYVDPRQVNYEEVQELCRKARFHPEQIICFCTSSRAEEAAAAILTGSRTPEEISARTGIRSGCTVECAQPLLRLLEAADIPYQTALDGKGWQIYGPVPTVWDIPQSVKDKYADRGFRFEEDQTLMEEIVDAPVRPPT